MIVKIDYTNYQGKREWRLVRPTGHMMFKSSAWHPKPQWVIQAIDVRRNVVRDFAMKDIHATIIPTEEDLAGISLIPVEETGGLQEPSDGGTTLTS